MFDRFSDHSKRMMSQAREQALALGHDVIAPEHVLLGLLQLPDSAAFGILRSLQVDLAALRADVVRAMPARGQSPPRGQLPFTPAAKRLLECTLEGAVQLGQDRIGSEHLLLALAGLDDTVAARALVAAGVTADRVRPLCGPRVPHDPERLRLLLISNSTMHGGGYLDHCAAEIRDFLGPRRRVFFVPFALADHDGYTAKARAVFATFGHDLVSAHEHPPGDPGAAPYLLQPCDAVFIGGGNTFRLLKALYDRHLLAAIRARVCAGMPAVGSSAGTNVATLSIRTTNDMPIVMPPSFTALQLVPFQINPHYLDPDPTSKHMGETREERIRQFHEEHDTPVLGLREGCMLRVEGTKMELRGTTAARLFRPGQPPEEFTPPADLSFLLAKCAV